MGKDLDYEGEKLQDFVKQQQDYERGERGIESQRKKLRQIRKGNLKDIGSRRRKKKGRISSRRKKKIGKSS